MSGARKKGGGSKGSSGSAASPAARVHLPKDALSRIELGHSFAEYDPTLLKPGVFVVTPQIALAAKDGAACFFVGRRGTGKTAMTYYLAMNSLTAVQLHPQIFALQTVKIDAKACRDTRQRPFRSLSYAFRRALLDELVREWLSRRLVKHTDLPTALSRERNLIDDSPFDERVIHLLSEFQSAEPNDKEWLRLSRRALKDIPAAVKAVGETPIVFLLDRIDEAWDGSDQAVLLLMALMHACVELSRDCPSIRPKLFLRENIFERVREIDNEFSRLETFVISMDWSQELLLEMIERRLMVPFTTKLPLRGPTWDHFFESAGGVSSRSLVFEYCQERPRDVLTYCKFAIESAQSHKHERVRIEDLQSARRRFSDSRLKDLGDEYAENFPQIQLILSRFFGLGTEFTVPGIETFIKKLLVDTQVKQHCGKWLFSYTTTERFIHLLYNIGFLGISANGAGVAYRSLGVKSSSPPPITATSHLFVHPSYRDALNLRDIVIGDLDDSIHLRESGLLIDLPDSINLNEYNEQLQAVLDDLKTLPLGDPGASRFEELVGQVIKLCFFRALQNVVPKERTVDGRVIRDWIAANRAAGGFWEMVRQRYGATQIIWECKNYKKLASEDFHQFGYYATPQIGGFLVCVFRGEVENHYYDHVKRIATAHNAGSAIVLLLTDKDLAVFIRQAQKGKSKEDHIQDAYDRTVRAIS